MPTAISQDIKAYIPQAAVPLILNLLKAKPITIKIKNERKTKHGDYKMQLGKQHFISINSNLNAYRFLITLVHEIAHFEAYSIYGRTIKPHGKEWKLTFKQLMLPFINPTIFPSSLLPLLAKHFKNPKATSDSDEHLTRALKQFDEPNHKIFIFEVPIGKHFKIYNGKVFRKGRKRTKRYEAIEVSSGRLYVFNPNAEVEIIN